MVKTDDYVEIIDLKRFEFKDVPSTSLCMILGKRGTGKSSLCQYIIQCSPQCSSGIFVVMCGSETVKDSWSKSIHPLFIQDPSVQYLNTFKDQRNGLVREYRRMKQDIPDYEHCTLVLDDIASIRNVMRSPVISYLASNSRHLKTSIFVLAQYACQIPAEVRNQFDIIFMLATADMKTIRRVHSEYCSITDSRIFEKVLSAATSDHGVLVIDNRTVSDRINDVCYYGRIDNYPFNVQRLGSTELWEFGHKYYMDVDNGHIPTAEEALAWEQSIHESKTPPKWNVAMDMPPIQREVHSSRRVFKDRRGCVVVRRI
jgi:hypothetical protein